MRLRVNNMESLIPAIAQVGFPIVVSILLLVRIEARMEKVSEKIEELTEGIVKLTTIIDERLKT